MKTVVAILVMFLMSKRKLILLVIVLSPLVVFTAAWVSRDRIAITLMDRELQRPSQPEKISLPPVDPALLDQLRRYLGENHYTPEEYILSKFEDHDVVFIGEEHRGKHDVEFIHRLIPLLHERGIQNARTSGVVCLYDNRAVDNICQQSKTCI